MTYEQIIRKYARLGPGGNPSHCDAHSGKVIFRTERAARLAADELYTWTTTMPLYAYPCPRAQHFHLTKMPQRSTGGDT